MKHLLKLFPLPEHIDATELAFRIGMYWRIGYGAVRVALALVLVQFIGMPASQVFQALARKEMIENPHDLLIRILAPFFNHFSFSITYFIAIYLIFWGLTDIVLSISLLKHKLWAFSASIYLISLFTAYEIYRYFHTHSLVLLGIIVIDIALVWIIGNEYRNLKRAAA